ncbi:MAG: hypothetical protein K2Q20_01230, partial [Phycisphaerales bacterium]|nr:hypothetical protein [Phycisphaerales bacterium]
LLMFDGSVNTRRTGDSNPGGLASVPNNPNISTTYTYTPDPLVGDPRPSNGLNSIQVQGHYRWTYKGIRGVDFAGKQ